eukprot:gnl/Spiro4/5572_TR2833_c0_g1_i1.p1 gnl/Spiro4/5572_TR2833_c0_g1~~gnl/Spiro4/5572_TR2833_c0_g1_i1.p1  ORF type:complete len:163 (+),score=37.76 gnl/Spiro4/5572_TR2833_c0_g1_i1:39-491(+)
MLSEHTLQLSFFILFVLLALSSSSVTALSAASSNQPPCSPVQYCLRIIKAAPNDSDVSRLTCSDAAPSGFENTLNCVYDVAKCETVKALLVKQIQGLDRQGNVVLPSNLFHPTAPSFCSHYLKGVDASAPSSSFALSPSGIVNLPVLSPL